MPARSSPSRRCWRPPGAAAARARGDRGWLDRLRQRPQLRRRAARCCGASWARRRWPSCSSPWCCRSRSYSPRRRWTPATPATARCWRCWGVGMVLGSLAFAGLGACRSGPARARPTLAIGVAYLRRPPRAQLAVACTASALGGIGNGVQWVALMTAVQALTVPAYQARVVGACSRRSPRPCRASAS